MRTITYHWDGQRYEIPTRDNQKRRLYRSEILPMTPIGDQSVEAVTAFVRKVEASKTWRKLLARSCRHGGTRLRIKDGRGCRMARGGQFYLVLPRWARNVPTVLHEMAHSATAGAHHNWPFAAALLVLVGRFIGREAQATLKASFKANRVKFRPPRKLSAERLAQLRALGQRLAAARRAPTELPSGPAA